MIKITQNPVRRLYASAQLVPTQRIAPADLHGRAGDMTFLNNLLGAETGSETAAGAQVSSVVIFLHGRANQLKLSLSAENLRGLAKQLIGRASITLDTLNAELKQLI